MSIEAQNLNSFIVGTLIVHNQWIKTWKVEDVPPEAFVD